MQPDLARLLRSAIAAIEPHDDTLAAGGRCGCVPCRAERLAARGLPSSTLGDGIHAASGSSMVEAAAERPDPWTRIDAALSGHLARMRDDAIAVAAIVAIIASHASDDDPIPVGRGHCQACTEFCTGDGANDRLRSGFCHRCTSAWARWRERNPMGLRPDFIRERRLRLGVPERQPEVIGA